jgi:hypothetical protein
LLKDNGTGWWWIYSQLLVLVLVLLEYLKLKLLNQRSGCSLLLIRPPAYHPGTPVIILIALVLIIAQQHLATVLLKLNGKN